MVTSEASLILHNTPIEEYEVEGIPVWVKREDLCTVPPLPPLAKLRGAELLLKTLKYRGWIVIGHHDSWYSKAGQGIAVLCEQLGLKCIVGYPRHIKALPDQLWEAQCHGAQLYGVRPNFIRVNYAMTRRYVEARGGYMLPFALACPESTIAVAREASTVPDKLLTGTLILSVGSGTILSGLLAGLPKYPDIIGISAGMSEGNQRKNIQQLLLLTSTELDNYQEYKIVPPPCPYAEQEDYPCPFPSHPNYDRKAWRWLCEHIKELKQPLLFWNIGQ